MKVVRKIVGIMLLCMVFGCIFLALVAMLGMIKAIIAVIAAIIIATIIDFALELLFQ